MREEEKEEEGGEGGKGQEGTLTPLALHHSPTPPHTWNASTVLNSIAAAVLMHSGAPAPHHFTPTLLVPHTPPHTSTPPHTWNASTVLNSIVAAVLMC